MKSTRIERLPDFKKGELLEYKDSVCSYIVLVTGSDFPSAKHFSGVVIFDDKSGYEIGYKSESFRRDYFKRFVGKIKLQN